MPAARLAGPDDLALVQDTTWAAYSSYLPVLGTMPLPVSGMSPVTPPTMMKA